MRHRQTILSVPPSSNHGLLSQEKQAPVSRKTFHGKTFSLPQIPYAQSSLPQSYDLFGFYPIDNPVAYWPLAPLRGSGDIATPGLETFA